MGHPDECPSLEQQLHDQPGVTQVVLDQQEGEALRRLRSAVTVIGSLTGRRAVVSQKSSIHRTTEKYSSRSSGFVMKQLA